MCPSFTELLTEKAETLNSLNMELKMYAVTRRNSTEVMVQRFSEILVQVLTELRPKERRVGTGIYVLLCKVG